MRPVSWLALRVPALYIDTGWELPKLQLHHDHDLRAYRRSFVAAATNRALRACAAFKGDVLLLESEHDDFIPPAVIKSYRAAFTHARSLTYRCMRVPITACRTRRASASTPGCSCSGSPKCFPMHAVIAAPLRQPPPRPARPRSSPRSSRRSPRRRQRLPEGCPGRSVRIATQRRARAPHPPAGRRAFAPTVASGCRRRRCAAWRRR